MPSDYTPGPRVSERNTRRPFYIHITERTKNKSLPYYTRPKGSLRYLRDPLNGTSTATTSLRLPGLVPRAGWPIPG